MIESAWFISQTAWCTNGRTSGYVNRLRDYDRYISIYQNKPDDVLLEKHVTQNVFYIFSYNYLIDTDIYIYIHTLFLVIVNLFLIA